MRALSYANGARLCSRDLLQLKPTMLSWVPHIACNIVPRQIVELGDGSKRAADACEAYGACAKRTIKHLTCRRAIGSGFRRGFIEQAFRRLTVRAGLIHGPENEPFLQRRDARMLCVGRSSAAHNRSEGPFILYPCETRAGGSSCMSYTDFI